MKELGMMVQWLQAQLRELRADLAGLRTAGDAVAAAVARVMRDETRTVNYRAESATALREGAMREQSARLAERDVAGRLAAVAERASRYTRSVAVRLARFTPECVLQMSFSDGEKRTIQGLAEIAESLERIRWGQDMERMDATELMATIDTARDAGSLALLGAVIREGRRRAQLPGGDAAIAYRAESVLRGWTIPELDEIEQLVAEIQQVGKWLDEARTALQTGEDPGRRQQLIYEAQQRGDSNDRIRELLAEQAAA